MDTCCPTQQLLFFFSFLFPQLQNPKKKSTPQNDIVLGTLPDTKKGNGCLVPAGHAGSGSLLAFPRSFLARLPFLSLPSFGLEPCTLGPLGHVQLQACGPNLAHEGVEHRSKDTQQRMQVSGQRARPRGASQLVPRFLANIGTKRDVLQGNFFFSLYFFVISSKEEVAMTMLVCRGGASVGSRGVT